LVTLPGFTQPYPKSWLIVISGPAPRPESGPSSTEREKPCYMAGMSSLSWCHCYHWVRKGLAYTLCARLLHYGIIIAIISARTLYMEWLWWWYYFWHCSMKRPKSDRHMEFNELHRSQKHWCAQQLSPIYSLTRFLVQQAYIL
jgi:hypothetical protein